MSSNRALSDFVLGGRWRFQRMIGAGNEGTVYLAMDEELEELVAIKVYDSLVDHEVAEIQKRIEEEARVWQEVGSRHLVNIINYGVARAQGKRQTAYMVMEYLRGETLRDYLERNKGSLPPPEVVRVFDHILEAVDGLHQLGWLHLDLKPENFFLLDDIEVESGKPPVKLFDFGNARPIRLAHEVNARATPLYASPEVCQRAERISTQADVYSLGILLYEMLTGEAPLDTTSVETIVAQHVYGDLEKLPPHLGVLGLGRLYERATVREIEQRYPSARQMRLALRSGRQS